MCACIKSDYYPNWLNLLDIDIMQAFLLIQDKELAAHSYYKHIDNYYKNLSRLGLFYDRLDYEKSRTFLSMPPKPLRFNGSV